MLQRCPWCIDDPLYIAYHDHEWGQPLHDETRLFEMLILEGAQAGLSWLTVLKKRANYRNAFDNFDAEKIARYTDADRLRLLADSGIVRNRLKIAAAIGNARAVLRIRQEHGSLNDFLWRFVDHRPILNHWQKAADVPVSTPLAVAISKELKGYGCKFVGPTICYAYIQSIGMVNDHLTSCFRYSSPL